MKIYLGPLEFVRLENFCAIANGRHDSGGMQNIRKNWRDQLDDRRGHLTRRERLGATPPEDRWVDLDEAGLRFVRKCLVTKKAGGWQHDVFDIFAGSTELMEMNHAV